VLLAPHHGSRTSSTPDFLDAVAPGTAVFQVGRRNRYRHPQDAVWQRYAERGIALWRTDRSGALAVQFDDRLTLRAYRQTHRRYWHAPIEAPADTDHTP
jgi:competence protein ComEC